MYNCKIIINGQYTKASLHFTAATSHYACFSFKYNMLKYGVSSFKKNDFVIEKYNKNSNEIKSLTSQEVR